MAAAWSSLPLAFWLEHATGLTALALTVSGLAGTSDAGLRMKTGLAAGLWAANNLSLGADAAAAVNLLTVLRQGAAVAVQTSGARIRALACAAFILLALLSGALAWQGWPTLAVLAASALTSYAMFYLRGRWLRCAMLGVSLLWLYHALVHRSVEQTLSVVITSAASLVGAWRLNRRELAAGPPHRL